MRRVSRAGGSGGGEWRSSRRGAGLAPRGPPRFVPHHRRTGAAMTTTFDRSATADRPFAVPVVRAKTGPRWLALITTTDHKLIGYMYLVVSFAFFLLAGVMALLIRAELFSPGLQIVNTKEEDNQL